MYTHTHTHARAHAHTHTHTHIRTHTRARARAHICTSLCTAAPKPNYLPIAAKYICTTVRIQSPALEHTRPSTIRRDR